MISKILAVGGLTLAIAVGFLWRANAKLNQKVGAQQQALDQEKFANEADVKTIYDLIMRNNTCVENQRVSVEAGDKLVADLRDELATIRSRKPVVVREEVYRDPSCAQLGAIDINAVCPALADGVRHHALAVSGSPNR